MTREAGSGAKRRQIANYMDSFPEEFEVLEDELGSDEPSIKLQTKTRIISLSCDARGKVIEDFTMRPGAGSKEDFLKKQEAYHAISQYYNDYYTGAKIVKKSFEEGMLKIELETRTVTLTYDKDNKSVEEKDRARRAPKEFQQMSLFDLPKNSKQEDDSQKAKKQTADTKAPASKASAKSKNAAASKKASGADKPEVAKVSNKSTGAGKPEAAKASSKNQPATSSAGASKSSDGTAVKIAAPRDKKYDRWSDGTIVKNICNNKKYKVKKDEGNIIEVFDTEHGYLIMARSDLVLSDL